MHCPPRNRCITTIYKFRKYFHNEQSPLVRNFYCENCLNLLIDEKTACLECNELPSKKDYFIHVSMIEQIKKLFSREDFKDKLSYCIQRQKINNSNLEDILDSNIYKELSQPNQILSNTKNLAFTWYSDSVTIFKSSKFSTWPVYLTINNPS